MAQRYRGTGAPIRPRQASAAADKRADFRASPLGHHYPGHLFESRRHQVVRTGRPNLAQSLLQQWEGRASVASVGLYLPGEQQGLDDPDAYAMRAEQLYRLGEELARPVEVAPDGRSQGEAVERVTGRPGIPTSRLMARLWEQ